MINSIIQWFKAAKPNPSPTDTTIQLGCHLEEIAEMYQALGLHFLQDHTSASANRMKANPEAFQDEIQQMQPENRLELLDALCDQIVTAVGVAHMMGFDIDGALNEVNRSNWSKFENDKPVFNEQGKIAKGVHYSPPDLSSFV